MTSLPQHLAAGQLIPALPLALNAERKWSEKHQRAVLRYYMDAGAGGIAVGVHSTQFEIREPQHALFEPVLSLAAETITDWLGSQPRTFARIAGVCGRTAQASAEAATALRLGYEAALLSVAAFRDDPETEIIAHCATVANIIPIIGFYLQTAVGGRVLSYRFWREFMEIPNVVAVKMAPFNRYQTLDVVRARIDSGREDIALYTGNDDNIIVDLLTPFRYGEKTAHIVGGLLGQWGVWTRSAVNLLEQVKMIRSSDSLEAEWLTKAAQLTDANGVVFDVAHNFAGCIPGIHEVLRRQGIFPTNFCLNPNETLSPGQSEELDRICQAYPWLLDNDYVNENLDRWLA